MPTHHASEPEDEEAEESDAAAREPEEPGVPVPDGHDERPDDEDEH